MLKCRFIHVLPFFLVIVSAYPKAAVIMEFTQELKQLSYEDTQCSLSIPALPGHKLTISWGFSGSGEPHELLLPLPSATCSIEEAEHVTTNILPSLNHVYLNVIYQQLIKAGILKQDNKQHTLLPAHLFTIKVFLLLLSAHEYDAGFIKQELFRLTTRLMLSDTSKNVQVPKALIHFLHDYFKGGTDLIEDIWKDCSISNYNVKDFLHQAPDARELLCFEFANLERAERCYEKVESTYTKENSLDDIITLIEQQGGEVVAHHDAS